MAFQLTGDVTPRQKISLRTGPTPLQKVVGKDAQMARQPPFMDRLFGSIDLFLGRRLGRSGTTDHTAQQQPPKQPALRWQPSRLFRPPGTIIPSHRVTPCSISCRHRPAFSAGKFAS
jgi:hypothetical protein